MAVALATLPLNRVLAGAGDRCFAGTTAAGLATPFVAGLLEWLAWVAWLALGTALEAGLATGLATGLEGAVFLATTLAVGFAAGFAPLLPLTLLAAGLPLLTTTAFFGAGFVVAAFFAGIFFATIFFATTFLAAAFFGTAFFVTAAFAGLNFLAGDLATGLLATGLAATFFATALPAGLLAGLPADLGAAFGLTLATDFGAALAGILLAFFTGAPLLATVVDLLALLADEGLAFCALAAVKLRVVFAISLHRLWPWRPGVIAHVSCTSKSASGILVPLPHASRPGTVNIPTRFLLWLLHLYKRWISPLLGPHCRFHPTCSDYARIAVTRFGPWRGSLLTGWRLLRCQPLCDGGEDPVPEHFHLPRCRCTDDSADHH